MLLNPEKTQSCCKQKTRTHILDLLLMEEILHQLIGSFSVSFFPFFTGFYTYQVVSRISSINRSSSEETDFASKQRLKPTLPSFGAFLGIRFAKVGWMSWWCLVVQIISTRTDPWERFSVYLTMDDLNLMVSINRYNIYIYIYHIQNLVHPILVKQWFFSLEGFGERFFFQPFSCATRKDFAANVLTVVPIIATEISMKSQGMRPQELSNSLRVSALLKDHGKKTYPWPIPFLYGIFTFYGKKVNIYHTWMLYGICTPQN